MKKSHFLITKGETKNKGKYPAEKQTEQTHWANNLEN